MQAAYGQPEPAIYRMLVLQADTLYAAKQYAAGAALYSRAFAVFGGKGYVPDRYEAACCWAMCGNADSAFHNLLRIATRANFAEEERLANEAELRSLHGDQRWTTLLQQVHNNRVKKESGKVLAHLLDSLQQADQLWRNYRTAYQNKALPQDMDTLTYKQISRKLMDADSLNYLLLKDIFARYGYPNSDLVGIGGAHAFWMLVQHQDAHPGFQDSVLSKMEVEVAQQKASAADWAYLKDRVLVNTGRFQLYGTQMRLNADSTSYEPKPLADPRKVNERRSAVGLASLELYIIAMNHNFWGFLKPRRRGVAR